MDKRDLAGIFRERLQRLVSRSGLNQSEFAEGVGLDRSALSQLLSGKSVRLPRAETLLNIAETHAVSLDWLLGLSQDEGVSTAISPALEIEESPDAFDQTLLARWHAEAAGTKIRYVPAGIPDLLRTDAVVAFEAQAAGRKLSSQLTETRFRVDYNRRPETDMEVCMPVQTLSVFAAGVGVWSELSAQDRRDQLDHMARLIDDLYPTFRLFLFDGRMNYSVPYTVFGPYRAAIYVGDMYLVLNATDAIRMMTRHFDNLIRAAEVHAHEAAAFVRAMKCE